MKTCSNPNCKQINPQELTEFNKAKKSKDGFQYWCKSCSKNSTLGYYKTTQWKATRKAYRQSPEGKAIIDLLRREYRATPEGKSCDKKYRESLEGKATIARLRKEYAQTPEGRAKLNATAARRRAKKLHAAPIWLTKEQHNENKEFYTLAQELQWLGNPIDPLEVDHIVPLQGENVSGLHVPWNLQILPQSLNCSKNNNFDSEEYNKTYFPEFCRNQSSSSSDSSSSIENSKASDSSMAWIFS